MREMTREFEESDECKNLGNQNKQLESPRMFATQSIGEVKCPFTEREIDGLQVRMIDLRRQSRRLEVSERGIVWRVPIGVYSCRLNAPIPHISINVIGPHWLHCQKCQSHNKQEDQERNQTAFGFVKLERIPANKQIKNG